MADEPALPAPRWWKVLARAEMKRKGLTQASLAQLIGGSQNGVSDALNVHARDTSRYVGPISRALGIMPPTFVLEAPEQHALMARLMGAVARLAKSNPDLLRIQADLIERIADSQGDPDPEE